MDEVWPAVSALVSQLQTLGWVSNLWVAGSLASGDYVSGVSDVDLVAVVEGPVDAPRRNMLEVLHQDLDNGVGQLAQIGCAYVAFNRWGDLDARHPTWTHGRFVVRRVSGITRAELVRFGFALFGEEPAAVLPVVTDDDVRRAACRELTGYWRWAARRPVLWLAAGMPDLGLTSMARGRHGLATGQLLTKTEAIEHAHAPDWLRQHLRDRRRGERVDSPRVRTARIAWRDARDTVALCAPARP